jgi:hypothetical protein
VAPGLVADELYLDLATLPTALLVVVVVVALSLALDATTLGGRIAIADRVRLLEVGGRGLIVLIGDVGHFPLCPQRLGRCVSRTYKKTKWWRYSFERGADGPILDLASRGEALSLPFCRRKLVGRRRLLGRFESGVPGGRRRGIFLFALFDFTAFRLWHALVERWLYSRLRQRTR